MLRTTEGSVTVISFDEDEHLRDPEPVRDFMRRIIDEGNHQILVDLANVAYISSAVLGLWITLFRELKEKNGSLKLVNIQPSISHIFNITRLDRIIEMFNDRETAIKSFE